MGNEPLEKKIKSVEFWWHSIRLNGGTWTPGFKTQTQLDQELKALQLPDVKGKTVLDIGAWDGFYSFECERRGAQKVTALDHYVWCMDVPQMVQYWKKCQAEGTIPQQYHTVPGMWRPQELPGKKGFDTAREVLGSKVEPVVADFMETDLDRLGKFDVVLFLGVLYHVHNPFEALKRLAQVTSEVAVIETEAIAVPGCQDSALCEFYETNELNGDVNNWWAPSEKALLGMCRAAGFKRATALVAPPQEAPAPRASFFDRIARGGSRGSTSDSQKKILHYRAIVHAYKS